MVQWASRTGAEQAGVHKATFVKPSQLAGDCLATTAPVYGCGTPRGDSVRFQTMRVGACEISSFEGT
jgi:hypothetical protein